MKQEASHRTKLQATLAVDRAAVARALARMRRRVSAGEWDAGQRLPTRRDLASQLGVSVASAQRALGILEHEGFLEARGSLGTFVADAPPHLSHYALVFPNRYEPESVFWSNFWSALRHEAEVMSRGTADASDDARSRRISLFYDIAGHSDVEDYRALLGHISARRLAGIILATPPHQLLDTPLLGQPVARGPGKGAAEDSDDTTSVPRVALDWFDAQRGIPGIGTDWTAFVDRAVAHLASQGRRRAAMVHLTFGYDWVMPKWMAACKRHGIDTRPAWVQPGSLTAGPNLANLVRLLLDRPRAQRIDGLIIADDHLVAGVTAGCLEVGAELGGPDRLSVVAHANFPMPQRGVRPAAYLGFDSRQIIRECIRTLDSLRPSPTMTMTTTTTTMTTTTTTTTVTRGERARASSPQPAQLTLLPPVFEHELMPARASAFGSHLVEHQLGP